MNTKEKKTEHIDFSYSVNIVELLKRLHGTIVMSTYQSGKIMLMGQHQDKFDVRYKSFPRPMGVFARSGRLWAGLGHGIHQFANFSAVTSKLSTEENFDACYLLQNIHYTGDIDIHEMEAVGNDLYFINTKFSCLCVKDPQLSFKPIWKPPFISLLQPLDKCHLNGFCTRDNQPRYATALGQTDEPLGWRANKANGGILMDIQSNEILAQGLSMPHSPRWHQGRLWLLESGKGSLSYFDFESKTVVEVASLPGFTRGLSFVGNLAFIGLSKVRESATFSGLPITKLAKRVSGVWVVNIHTGKIISCIEFTAGIDEVFAVSVLPHARMELLDAESPQSHANYLIAAQDVAQVRMPETPLEQASPHFERGNDLMNENKKEEAIVAFRQALAIRPDFLPATFNIAVALGDLERFEEAEALLQEVLDKDASLIEAYDSLGYVCYKKGDLEAARNNFLKVLELAPGNKKAKNSLDILDRQAGTNT
jgi:uncharacterized protein (TIGR03032 family)